MSLNGDRSMPPLRAGIPISDTLAGLYAAFRYSGRLAGKETEPAGGQEVTCAHGGFADQHVHLRFGGLFSPPVNCLHATETTTWCFPRTGCMKQRTDLWRSLPARTRPGWLLCKALGREDLPSDPRFETEEKRRENRGEINRIVGDIIKGRSKSRVDRSAERSRRGRAAR